MPTKSCIRPSFSDKMDHNFLKNLSLIEFKNTRCTILNHFHPEQDQYFMIKNKCFSAFSNVRDDLKV